MSIKKVLLFFTLISSTLFAAGQPKGPPCSSKEACLNDPECFCWCSVECGWRKKTKEDYPTYIDNDQFGKYCYCKQWDFDYYKANCIEGKNIKQPKGMK